MKKAFRWGAFVMSSILACSVLSSGAFAEDVVPKGYIYNPQTQETIPYYNSPSEVLQGASVTPEDMQTTTETTVQPRGFNRVFVGYSPGSFKYDYENARYKIGVTRLDNRQSSEPAALTFKVHQSSSCGVSITSGVEYGGEVNAVFGSVSAKYGSEVSANVSWSQGTEVSTNAKVPAGQIGRVTAYVIGVYTAGTATYRVLNTTTGEMWDETGGLGALVPTNNAWNLVVQIPST